MIPVLSQRASRRRMVAAAGGGNSATFIASDASTHGAWIGVYGSAGKWISNAVALGTDYSSLPGGVTASVSGNLNYVWDAAIASGGINFTGSLEYPGSGPTDPRLAATWYTAGHEDFDIAIASGSFGVSLYLLDWDNQSRVCTVEVFDGDTLASLDGPRTVDGTAGYATGVYLRWTINGHVIVRVTYVSGAGNVTASAVFFD